MITIRNKAFESNSSSSHSICIAAGGPLFETLVPDDDGILRLEGGEFGWGYEDYDHVGMKAEYIATALRDMSDDDPPRAMFIRVLKEHTGAKEVRMPDGKDWSVYIDHQSSHVPFEALESEDKLKNFLFNPDSTLVIDNDNH